MTLHHPPPPPHESAWHSGLLFYGAGLLGLAASIEAAIWMLRRFGRRGLSMGSVGRLPGETTGEHHRRSLAFDRAQLARLQRRHMLVVVLVVAGVALIVVGAFVP